MPKANKGLSKSNKKQFSSAKGPGGKMGGKKGGKKGGKYKK